jgi:hypothetical protein
VVAPADRVVGTIRANDNTTHTAIARRERRTTWRTLVMPSPHRSDAIHPFWPHRDVFSRDEPSNRAFSTSSTLKTMVKRLLGTSVGIAALAVSLGISADSASASVHGRHTHASSPSRAIVKNPAVATHVVVMNPITGRVVWSSGTHKLPKHFVILNPSNGRVVYQSR